MGIESPPAKSRRRVVWSLLAAIALALTSVGVGLGLLAHFEPLPPAERIALLEAAHKKYSVPPSVEGRVTFQGTIRRADGLPLRNKILATIQCEAPGNSISAAHEFAETFLMESDPGVINLQFPGSDDYAPLNVGPFAGKAGEVIEGLDIVLERGFPLVAKVVNQYGDPVRNAEVGAAPEEFGIRDKRRTDEHGIVRFPFAVEAPYWIIAEAEGHASERFHSIMARPGEQLIVLPLTTTKSPGEAAPEETHEIDNTPTAADPLSEPERKTRRISFQLQIPEGGFPGGSIEVSAYGRGNAEHVDQLVKVSQEMSIEVPVPSRMIVEPNEMLGYWFETQEIDLEATDRVAAVALPLGPAGAITGQIVEADGTAVRRSCRVSLSVVGATFRTTNFGSGLHDLGNIAVGPAARFFVNPVPLGGTYEVHAFVGRRKVSSGEFTLRANAPIRELTLRLPRMIDVEGRVLDPEGNGLPGVPLTVICKAEDGSEERSFTESDGAGGFRIADVTESENEYIIEARPRAGYQSLAASLRRNGAPTILQLKPGLALSGTVVDDATGTPVPNARVIATLPEAASTPPAIEANTLSDAQGVFRFTNLSDTAYRLEVEGRATTASEPYRPGEEAIELRVGTTRD